jgi:hypothetical protein
MTCVLIKRRVHFQQQLLGPITLAMALCATFFVVLATWIVDYSFIMHRRTGLFKEQGFYDLLNACTQPAMIALLVLGWKAISRLYRM